MPVNSNDRHAIRSELVQTAKSLLLGPIETEEVIASPPLDTYLTGILWPRGAELGGAEDDAGLELSREDEGSEPGIPGYRANRPCSIGITFAVSTGAVVCIDLGSTARYAPREAHADDALSGDVIEPGDELQEHSLPTNQRMWHRRELGYSLVLDSTDDSFSRRVSTFQLKCGQEIHDPRLSLSIRKRIGPAQDVYTITLINEENEVDSSAPRDSRCLFQAELRVRSHLDGVPAVVQRPSPPIDRGDADALMNALLYRGVRQYAVGHGVAATWDGTETRRVLEVKTSWIPDECVRGTSADGHTLLDGYRAAWPEGMHARSLAQEGSRTSVIASLEAFSDCYEHWIDSTLVTRLGTFGDDLEQAARTNLDRCKVACHRIRDGIRTLRENTDAWTAFVLANSAMAMQADFPAKGAERKPLVWRPFQLAFLLMVLSGQVDTSRDDRDYMDLLWFPTGGGKTEAYLALTAFEIFYHRLTSSARREAGGVDVMMRYTMRLLTVQQFQRAASLICACELLRVGDGRLGDARITLGLYVGADATPNKMEHAREAIAQEMLHQKPSSTPRQLLLCPVCGSDLPIAAYSADPVQCRIDIVCRNPTCETQGTPLPVSTVDEAIYASPPSLLIGTVDKFAQLPRRTDMRSLFALDAGDAPGLIIQDELHLISGPLGSMVGLYETVIDNLCTRSTVRPKVVGSTATIGNAERQVRSLFNRAVVQFPPPGFDSSDSFFAVRDDKGPDRLYIGLSTAGRSPKFSLQALLASLMQSAEFLRVSGAASDKGIDPYWTCVAYFNSLRELGGAHVLMQDDVPRQMQFLARRLNVDRRKLEELVVELSSRKSSRELPELLHKISGNLEDAEDPYGSTPAPPDSVLASNMISVGVDVPRLGLMVINGQPKSTAEYIQASSRVGRGLPGLVVTLYNFGRPRDLSHFEHFRAYHAALYRSVEATSVTPWAPRARDKALHAVVASLVRHLVPGLVDDEAAVNFDRDDTLVGEIMSSVRERIVASADAGEAVSALADLNAIVEAWANRSADARSTESRLRYWIKKAPFGREAPHLMCAAEDGGGGARQAWPTPNSMREVEPSTAFFLKTIRRKAEV